MAGPVAGEHHLKAQPAPVYRYRWDYKSNWPIAATHATDIAPTLDDWDEAGLQGGGPGNVAGAEPADLQIEYPWPALVHQPGPLAS
jgi:hypothetical protein